MGAPILIPVLGDQLSHELASLRGVDRGDAVVLMMEVADETTYVRHHKKKVALVLAAMRHFAAELRAEGWRVDYVRLDDPANGGSFDAEVAAAARRHGARALRVVEAGEHRVQAMLEGWEAALGVPVEILADDRFLVSRDAFARWAAPRKRLRMEDFYRVVRARHGWLMEAGQPVGGRWNLDHDNRKRPPRGLNYPAPPSFEPDGVTREVLDLVAARFADHFGDLEPFALPVTRAQALACLDAFVAERLARFGDYQDAMVDGQDTLYHSQLSASLNLGLLTAREVVDAAEAAFARGEVPLNSAEGFIRQIVGWREYVRGLYFLAGPGYVRENALQATRPLPGFYWTGGSGMRCLDEAVGQTRRTAHAHHIQRLMVLGNFAMLAGIDPHHVHEWFLVVYADAYEWVEAPNVIGMSQFADGGMLGSKPYAAGGAYIDRMSDHCRRCRYDVRQRTGPDACPFNYLYWDFLARHEERLRTNQRMWPVYDGWRRMAPDRQAEIRSSAAAFLASLEPAGPGWATAQSGGAGGKASGSIVAPGDPATTAA